MKFILIICYLLLLSSTIQSQDIYRPNVSKDSSMANNDILAKLMLMNTNTTKKISLKALKLTKFPTAIFRFKNLEELDLSGNNIMIIPDEIGNLEKLRIFNINSNRLQRLPINIKKLTQISHLGIAYNKFKVFPDEVNELTSLKTFDISGNQLIEIPEDIKNLKNLTDLYCAHNNLTFLPKNIGKLTKLRTLFAFNNLIKKLPNEITNLKELSNLQMYNNNLTELPNTMGEMKGLVFLGVSKNNFKEIPKELTDIPKLKKLYIKRKDEQSPQIPDELLAYIRDNVVETDIYDINSRFVEFGKRQQQAQLLATEEKRRKELELENAKKEAALAESQREQAESKRRLIETESKRNAEREAAKREKLEREKELSEAKRKEAEIENKAREDRDAAKIREKQIENDQKQSQLEKEKLKTEKALFAGKAAKEKADKDRQFQQTIISVFIGGLIIAGLFMIFVLYSNRKIKQKQKEAEMQKAKADSLLLNILPFEVAEELKEKGTTQVRTFDDASVLFADIKGFSALASKVTPQELIKQLDNTFGMLDDITKKYNIERIKTIGDCYMCVGGVPTPDPAHAVNMIMSALEIQHWMADEYERLNGDFWQVRLGVHVGDLVAGVVGKSKFAYDVWGHAVNTASRMESGGEVGKVNITLDTYEKVKDFFICTYRGQIEAKNIGLVDTYFVNGLKPEYSINGLGKEPNEAFFINRNLIK
ncbi:MAG: hypothetical protein EAZ85_04990 [Bacteroidetes bacterium]|nr:MAG: hypothetical protein EAZ85_04990 [Bacteroidota bacterium]TAG85382.1 MAG: hypothetical protein EAZ20_15290 [Bacteroidota bacterium]